MNEKQAIAALTRLFGKRAAWRRNESAPVGEERDAAKAHAATLVEARDAAKAARDARRAELLRDPEFVRLCDEARTAIDACDKAVGRCHARRVTVGYVGGAAGLSFFHVAGEGDNWQEAVDAAKASKVRP